MQWFPFEVVCNTPTTALIYIYIYITVALFKLF